VVDYSAGAQDSSAPAYGQRPDRHEITRSRPRPAILFSLAPRRTAYEALITDYMKPPDVSRWRLTSGADTLKSAARGDRHRAGVSRRATVKKTAALDLVTKATAKADLRRGDRRFTEAECAATRPQGRRADKPAVMASIHLELRVPPRRWVQETWTAAVPRRGQRDPADIGGARSTPRVDVDSSAGAESGGRVFQGQVALDLRETATRRSTTSRAVRVLTTATGTYKGRRISVTTTDGAPAPRCPILKPDGHRDHAGRLGKPAADLSALGAAIAADPM